MGDHPATTPNTEKVHSGEGSADPFEKQYYALWDDYTRFSAEFKRLSAGYNDIIAKLNEALDQRDDLIARQQKLLLQEVQGNPENSELDEEIKKLPKLSDRPEYVR